MIFRHSRKEAREQRTDESSEKLYDAAAFAYLHQSHPQRKDAGKSYRYLEGLPRRIERRIHYVTPYRQVAIDGGVEQSY